MHISYRIYVLYMLYVLVRFMPYAMFVTPCAIVAILSLYLSFFRFGLLVRTQSGPYGFCHHPYTLAHIKGFGSLYLHVYACLLYTCVSLFSSRLCHIWRPQQVCGYVVTSDGHEALFGCNHLGGIAMMPVALCIPLPFSALCDDMLTILVCDTCWLSLHLYTLAYMSMHESCSLVCCPYFNTMKLWTFNSNLHLSLADTSFYLLSCLFPFWLAG